MAEDDVEEVAVHLKVHRHSCFSLGGLYPVLEVLDRVCRGALGVVGAVRPPSLGPREGGDVGGRHVRREGLVDNAVRVVRVGQLELAPRHDLVPLVGKRVGVASDEGVDGDEEVVQRRVNDPAGGGAEPLLKDVLLAQLVLVEVLDHLHSRDLASGEQHRLPAHRLGRRVEVHVGRHHVQTYLALELLVGEVELHVRVDLEAVQLEVVVLVGHHLVDVALEPRGVAASQSPGKQVVKFQSVCLHISFCFF